MWGEDAPTNRAYHAIVLKCPYFDLRRYNRLSVLRVIAWF